MNMTKNEICARMSARLDKPAADLKPIVEGFLDEVIAVLAEGRRIEIRGFGAFNVKHRRSRVGRNPRTGEIITIPDYDVPVFKFSAEAEGTFEGLRKDADVAKKFRELVDQQKTTSG